MQNAKRSCRIGDKKIFTNSDRAFSFSRIAILRIKLSMEWILSRILKEKVKSHWSLNSEIKTLISTLLTTKIFLKMLKMRSIIEMIIWIKRPLLRGRLANLIKGYFRDNISKSLFMKIITIFGMILDCRISKNEHH